jgi:uncharacterized protein (TIGR00369 family)
VSRLAAVVEAWLAGERELAPITGLLGVRPVSLGGGEAVVELDASERLHNAMGTVHGGVLCDLADVAMGVALATATEDGESFATLQLQIGYLAPVREGVLRASARLLHRGRGAAHLECDLHDGDGKLVARASSVVAIKSAAG